LTAFAFAAAAAAALRPRGSPFGSAGANLFQKRNNTRNN
jgi:hypothetical protein